MKIKIVCIEALLILLMLSACAERVPQEKTEKQPEIFPDYKEVTVPRTIAPLNFRVDGATHIQAIAKDCNSDACVKASGKEHVEFDLEDWHALLAKSDSVSVSVSIWDDTHTKGIKYADFKFYMNDDEIDPWLMYRLLPPGYEGWNNMGIYQRNLTNFKVQTIVDNTDNGQGCLNCHAACQGNPDRFTFHSRGENGGTIVQCNGNLKKVNLTKLGRGMQGSYNAWHPSGKFIAFSSNFTQQAFMGRSINKIEAYDHQGDLMVYDVHKNEVYCDDRFIDSTKLISFPTFSPDGKWLYFIEANQVEMPVEYKKLRYSILRVAFNEQDGSLGEQIDTIFSAYERQRSAIIPRISPDGRFLMYSSSIAGYMLLYHHDADLGMIDLETMEDVDCSRINSDQSESYHGWSSNGKWVLFSSKRLDGRFTRVLIAHWDGKEWGKPFLLPQKNPYENVLNMMAYNVPDFLTGPINISRSQLRKLIMPERK